MMSCVGVGQAEETVELEHVVERGVELLDQEIAQIFGHAGVDAEADDVAAAAALERRSRTAAPDPRPLPRFPPRCRAGCGTCPCPTTAKPGKSWSRNRPIICSTGRKRTCLAGQAHEARDRGRDKEQRLHPVAVAAARSNSSARPQPEIGDERERDAPDRWPAASAPGRSRPGSAGPGRRYPRAKARPARPPRCRPPPSRLCSAAQVFC